MRQYDEVRQVDEQEEFSTGSKRGSRRGKGRFDLITPIGLMRLAQHYENGAVGYGERNWEKGQPLSRYIDSGIRHFYQFLCGFRDEDHLAAAAWNALGAIHTEEMVRRGLLPEELDDLPDFTGSVDVLSSAVKDDEGDDKGDAGTVWSEGKPVVYVAGQYRSVYMCHDSVWVQIIKNNVEAACAVSNKLLALGYAVICPHAMSYGLVESASPSWGHEDDRWIDALLPLVDRADVLVLIDGWRDSEGSLIERRRAIERGIPVVEWDAHALPPVEEFTEWVQAWKAIGGGGA